MIETLYVTDLRPVKQRAIIINHNTKAAATLALQSAIRYAGVPILLIDCQSTDGSKEYFRSLNQEFTLLHADKKSHGKTLDCLFTRLKDDQLLLIDSDLEILNSEIIEFMNRHISDNHVYGAGLFEHGGIIGKYDFGWSPEERTCDFTIKYTDAIYHERPFIPLVLYKREPIAKAIRSGVSFNHGFVNNEFSLLPKMFYWRAKKIFRKGFRKKVSGQRPSGVYYDTGARIDRYLKKHGFDFSGIPATDQNKYIKHYMGATRKVIFGERELVGEAIMSGRWMDEIEDRLINEYGIDLRHKTPNTRD